ncbi:MAG: hypothetical protein JXA11_05980 [Phycisphaerae bacterium]|nr:hypothetical protein [Phycisphaerae bacterium]
MVFRIRYVEPEKGRPATETIEANSPAEAMVKFNVRHGAGRGLSRQDCITSVTPVEELLPEHQW